MTRDGDDHNPMSGAEEEGSDAGDAREELTSQDYTCHTCGFTRRAVAPPLYCPRCHAETHSESS